MRDIREDLQERLELVKQQINAEQNRFEKLLKQSSSEQDSKVRYVKAELETVKRVIEIEHRRLGSTMSDQELH
jgi:alanyl-tRNA synthetase